MRKTEVLALGAALYPLGRLLWRAGRGPPGRAGKEFLENLGREELKTVAVFQLLLDGWSTFESEVQDKTLLDMGRAIKTAAELLGDCHDDNPGEPLRSVFTLVNIGGGEPGPLYYRAVELDLSKELPVPGEREEIPAGRYAELVGTLEYYLRHSDFEVDASRVLGLLERFLTFVPACTSNPAVSFYDYARLLSALAVAIWKGNGEKPFLFVEGDLSGIQRFVFRITSKGALKMLRARSVYLDLLSWDIVIEILERLGLPRSCILYNGGGSFTLIVPNTDENIKTLESIRGELERFLLENFDGQLYVAIDWDGVSLEEMRTFRNGRLWADLKAKVGERKSKRFMDVIEEFVDSKGYEKREECAVCRKQITEDEADEFKIVDETGEELKLCRTCHELWHLGMALPKGGAARPGNELENLVFARVDKDLGSNFVLSPIHGNSIELPFSRFYWFGSIKALEDRTVPPGSQVLLRNSLDLWKVPGKYKAYPYVVADYAKLIEEKGRLLVMDFEKLAENSLGAKKIGVFKADVDNLGLIFSRGLRDRNPALVAELSRLMDYFFKAYLRALIAGDVERVSIPDDIPGLPTAREFGVEKHRGIGRANIVVIYAGGDDLFIVGSWNEVFNMAFLVRETFKRYSGNNPNINLSAGFATFNHDFPVYRMAQVAEERLEGAKDEGKNRIFLMERTVPRDYGREENFPASFSWDGYIELWRKYRKKLRVTPEGIEAEVVDENGKRKWKRIPKSQLWKILEFREIYARNPEGIRWNYMLAYHLKRAGLDNVFGNLVPIDVSLAQSNRPQEIYWMDGILKPFLFAVRR